MPSADLVRDRRRRTMWWCAGVWALLVSAHAVAWFVRPQPRDLDDLVVLSLVLAGIWLVTGSALMVMAIVSRRPAPAILVAVVLALFVVSVLGAELVHWRWSRADFEVVAAAEQLPCGDSERCRVGWWDATDVETFGSFTIVWTEPGCYAGQGFAVPTDPGATRETIASALNERAGSHFEVTDWHDGWFEVCGRT